LAESQHQWLTDCLWTGAVPYLGAPAIALVGSFDEIAGALWEYRQVGIVQFLFMGWPDLEEMKLFSRHVEPLVRARESQLRQEASCL
jgi:alkanesulfonate monooxygenase